MEKREDQIVGSDLPGGELPIAERAAFKPDEMVACGKCGRTNPPNRMQCFYCAAELEIEELALESIRPVLRKLEGWEKGYNVIYQPGASIPGREAVTTIARAIALDAEAADEIFRSSRPMPLARVEGEREAAFVEETLRAHGIDTSIVTDRSLAEEIPPKRLRTIEFSGDELRLTLFNTNETITIQSQDLALIVAGAVFEKKTEVIEKRKKGSSKTLDEIETASDEMLIDIYTATDPAGWRIPTKGFDFSCLGNEKGMLAVRNMRKLLERLVGCASGARYIDSYLADRNLLSYVWEVEEHKDFRGLQRSGFGKVDFGKISTSKNLGQFTKYSRFQWQLL
jgi:hypothetical protein